MLRDELDHALRDAMRARDDVARRALRSALGALANAEAVPVEHASTATAGASAFAGTVPVGAGEAQRRTVTEDEARVIVEAEIDEWGASPEADVLRRVLAAHRPATCS